MSDEVFRELDRLISAAGCSISFDSGRDITKSCTFCGSNGTPRSLLDIGTYNNGETLTRPVCASCAERNKVRIEGKP